MESRTPTIGLLADPGIPYETAEAIVDGVAESIHRELAEQWRIEISRETLPLSPEGTIELSDHAPQLRRRHGWDVIIYLSDLPRYVDDQPMIAEVSAETRTALITVPTLGGARLRARTRDLVLSLVTVILRHEESDDDSVATMLGRADVRLRREPDRPDLVRLVLTGRLRALQVLSGMVRSNRPGGLLSALTGCIAAAIATGAFGVFYGSLTSLADTLSPWRLALISLLVIAVLTAWLIRRNSLWNTERGSDEIWRSDLDNASTVITVGLSVLYLYVGLFLAMLVLAVTVLPPEYLQGMVQTQVGVLVYVKLAWLCASMATMAGALGANFDHEDAVREATFSRRYHERRKLFDTYEGQEQDYAQDQG